MSEIFFNIVALSKCRLYVFVVCSMKKEHLNTGTDCQYLCLWN